MFGLGYVFDFYLISVLFHFICWFSPSFAHMVVASISPTRASFPSNTQILNIALYNMLMHIFVIVSCFPFLWVNARQHTVHCARNRCKGLHESLCGTHTHTHTRACPRRRTAVVNRAKKIHAFFTWNYGSFVRCSLLLLLLFAFYLVLGDYLEAWASLHTRAAQFWINLTEKNN